MAFNRPFSGNGRFNRGGNGGGNNFRQGNNFSRGGNNFRGGNQNQEDASEQLPNRGIAWGNKYRPQQKAGAPVLQGYLTDSNGQKFRLTGFLNPRPEDRENPEAQEYKEQIAAEINAILTEAQEAYGIAFNLSLQDEEEWKNERNNASRGGNNRRDGSGGSPRTNFRPAARSQQEDVPFNNNQQDDNGDDPEPDAAPATTRRRAPAKPPAKGKATKPAPKRASRSTK